MDEVFHTLIAHADDLLSPEEKDKRTAVIQAAMDRRQLFQNICKCSEIIMSCKELMNDLSKSWGATLKEIEEKNK